MKKTIVLATVALAACAGVNPEMKSATDALAQTRGSHDVSAAARFAPTSWAEGQWVLFRYTKKDATSVTRQSVVGREDGGFWIETENLDYHGKNVQKMLFTRQPKTAEDALDALVKIVSWRDGKKTVIDFSDPSNPAAGFMKAFYKSMLQGSVLTEPADFQKDDATVAAGRFRGCYRFASQASYGPIKVSGTAWVHPSVPLNGMVKMDATDGSWSMELLDYGVSGAKSAMPE